MVRIDRVREYVESHTSETVTAGKRPGVSAAEVALNLRIHRNDASADLNKLFRSGYIEKSGTKPVLYFSARRGQADTVPDPSKANHSEIPENKQNADERAAFSGIIGSEGSLKAQIELAKAAVVYPPSGLHTLLCGESGVGKSLMAEAMWRYAAEIRASQSQSDAKIPFVTFCCADYADNSQLLLSQLFGYVKGAFTGADEDREGFVDRARGGILFLDEIHRLPPAGQEILFMLVDKGTYRRLGETREERKAQVMLIGATSEDLASSLLTTFRRRIPVQIMLPRISERPLKERIALIAHFVKQEAIRLGLPIWISGEALQTFSYYNCPANIGELRNDLQLCCAKSYLAYLASSSDKLIVAVDVIPQRIFSMVRDKETTENSTNRIFKEGILVQPGGQPLPQALLNDYELPIDLYGFIDKKMEAYRQTRLSDAELERQVGKDLEKYFDAAVHAFLKPDIHGMPLSIVQQNIWEAANLLLNNASDKMSRKYGRKTLVALALHLQQFKERAASGRIIYNPNLKSIQAEQAKAYSIVTENIPDLTQKLGVDVPPDEIGFIAMFLVHGFDDAVKQRIGLIVVAHGRGTAQSMAEVANNLLGTDHVKAYDIPLNKSNAKTVEELQELVLSANEGKGVILLVDMGFLVTMESMLTQTTNVPLRIIPNVTTALVLEAGRRVLTTEECLEQAVDTIYDLYDEYTLTLRRRRHSLVGTKGTVLLTCSSGAGVAEKIKEILLSHFPDAGTMNFITAGAMSDVRSIAAEWGGSLRMAVGSMDPNLGTVPFIHVSELFTPEGLRYAGVLLAQGAISESQGDRNQYSEKEVFMLLAGQLNKFVKTLPLDKIKLCCEKLVEEIRDGLFEGHLSKDTVVRIYLHAACMFDRINAGDALLPPEWGEQIQADRRQEFQQLKRILCEAGAGIMVEVPDSEICYFLSILPDRHPADKNQHNN
ncbi:sigma 54-interacting transcriptional regulator [Acetonema longum]|uniref:PTS system transcriptional activator n=1 Tax=Acetonema longum DSM 6540 TaxID=1009370 RepID=F7NLJ2_9FIRM|nr:sigma 54-interacting transcriptional regulator [Acetonema longum]EGO63087.1 PTS system transcriptional activator [Acetonema longum DSM 6540]